jgi:hypothetical protein
VYGAVQSVAEWPGVWRSGILTAVSCHVVCLLRTRHKCGSQSSCLPHLGESYMMLHHDSCAVLLNLRVFLCSAEAGAAHPEATQALRRKVSPCGFNGRVFLFCACVYTENNTVHGYATLPACSKSWLFATGWCDYCDLTASWCLSQQWTYMCAS